MIILAVCIPGVIAYLQSRKLHHQHTEVITLRTVIKTLEGERSEFDYLKRDLIRKEYEAKFKAQDLELEIETLKAQHLVDVSAARADALKRSTVIRNGFSWENFAPLLGAWPQGDFRHLGDPIDFLVCAGASAIRDNTADEISSIVLLDVKTGKSTLNKTQRRIRDAIINGRVTFAIFNPETGQIKEWKYGNNKAIERTNEQQPPAPTDNPIDIPESDIDES